MSRTLRIVLAVVALALTVAGVVLGRFLPARELAALFAQLGHVRNAGPQQLGEGLFSPLQHEMLGEGLVALGLVVWVILGAQIGRSSVAFTVAAVLVTLAAGAVVVAMPSMQLPTMSCLRPPSNQWPYGIVSVDKKLWNVFIIRSPKNEWAVSVEHSSPLGPEGLKNALERRFGANGSGKRPVRIYLDMSCPDDIQKVFVDAAHSVADRAGVDVDAQPLPDRDNFQALRRIRRDEQLSKYRDVLQLGILSRIATAAALALVVWWTPGKLRGASIVAAGNLILAFGQAVALPVALYVAMLPDEAGSPDWKLLASHVQPHVWVACASAFALVVGSFVGVVGQIATPSELPDMRLPRLTRAPIAPRAPAPSPAEPEKSATPVDPPPPPVS